MIFDYAIFNGELAPLEQAQISIFNDALFASFGVYETVKIDRGRPFYLKEHLQRLHNSAAMIDLALGVDVDTLTQWFERLRQVDPKATWSLKIIAFGSSHPQADIGMQALPLPTYAAALYKQGATAILYPGQRFLPACKSLNTLVNFLARREATQAGALEGLLHHDGSLTEGTRTNLFAVRQGQLITPPDTEVLSGITRDIILHVMKNTDYPVVESSLPVDLSLYEELFISSTSMHVMPITTIDGQPVNNGQVGPVTRLAMQKFDAFYRQAIGTM